MMPAIFFFLKGCPWELRTYVGLYNITFARSKIMLMHIVRSSETL